MAERYLWSECEKPIGFDLRGILQPDAELAGDSPYQVPITGRFRRSDEHQCLSAGRKPVQLTKKMGFETSVERENLWKKASHSELLGAELSHQLDDCQWVSLCLRDDSAYRSTIERRGRNCREQFTRSLVDQADQMQIRKSVERKRMIHRLPQSEEQHDAFGIQSTAYKAEDFERLAIEPLSIIDDTREGLVGRRRVGEQRESCQSHEEPVGVRSFGLTKRRVQGRSLRSGKTFLFQLPWEQESLQSGEAQFDFCFET